MPSERTGKPEPDVLDLLAEEQAAILEPFSDFHALGSGRKADDEAKQRLVDSACSALMIHAQLEEEVLYPALRNAQGETVPLREAEARHAAAAVLLDELERTAPDEPFYDARFEALGDWLRRHAAEERALFARAREAGIALDALAERLRTRREALQREFGLPEDDDALEIPAAPFRAANGSGAFRHGAA